MKLDLKTREQLRDLNSQDWSDFKAQWPMRVVELLLDVGAGTLLGLLLGLSVLLYALRSLGA